MTLPRTTPPPSPNDVGLYAKLIFDPKAIDAEAENYGVYVGSVTTVNGGSAFGAVVFFLIFKSTPTSSYGIASLPNSSLQPVRRLLDLKLLFAVTCKNILRRSSHGELAQRH
jgi:hypothetical protein